MRWLLILVLLLSVLSAAAQLSAPMRTEAMSASFDSNSDDLPDAPSAIASDQENVVAVAEASFRQTGDGVKPCNAFRALKVVYYNPNRLDAIPKPCSNLVYPYQKFLGTNIVIPLTWQ